MEFDDEMYEEATKRSKDIWNNMNFQDEIREEEMKGMLMREILDDVDKIDCLSIIMLFDTVKEVYTEVKEEELKKIYR